MSLPVPNLALSDVGASLRAADESVGPISSLHLLIALSPMSSSANIGPLDMNCMRLLENPTQLR